MTDTGPMIYLVRKSFDNIKSQKGAYFVLESAIKRAIITRRNVYDSNKKCVWSFSDKKSQKNPFKYLKEKCYEYIKRNRRK